ncbi:MAG: Crp/Fnr family transcriptional regulator [Trueperaceae bacterium]|nr:Crp/Fnr family transcriptional regulator [Trueperaceae bacterium]
MTPPLNTLGLSNSQTNPPPVLALEFPRRSLKKGDTLYYAGDLADTVYRIEEGLLKLSIDLLTGKERITSIVGPGDYIGGITPAHTYFQETAEALSPQVSLTIIPTEALDGELKEQVFVAAGNQLGRLRDALEDSELPVTSRLARTFVRLGERFGHIADDKTVRLTLPLTHDNLAAMVGAARETTTALMGEMRDQGILDGTRGRYSFNLNDLSEFASESAFIY